MFWTKALQKLKGGSRFVDDPLLGCQVQFPGITKDFQNKQIVFGLDFGTAFTKVVLGDDRIRYAIPLQGAVKGIESYLQPCCFWVESDGTCSLQKNHGKEVSALKMRMLNGDLGESVQQEICAFLALVLKRARAYFFTQYKQVYKKNYIRWLVNVGLPTSSYHDKELVAFYKKIVKAAWIVSVQESPVTLALCADALDLPQNNSDEKLLHEDLISPFPEFVAQMTGYVRSPMRNSDLHFLVDVGAGTVDATVFNVHEDDGEDLFPIFAKMVKPLGTQYLVQNRLALGGKDKKHLTNAFEDIPKIDEFASLLNKDIHAIKRIDSPFRQKLTSGLLNILTYTKGRRYPLSRTWENGIPTFLCGGGGNCDFYIDSILSSSKLGDYKLLPKVLPKPENLKADKVGSAQYNRLSVAYGLSFDPFDIGEIIKMEDIEDILPEKAGDTKARKTSRSVYCHKCRGTGGLHGYCEDCGGSGFRKC